MPTQPQDHKPSKGEPFKFTGRDGKTYSIPLASKARKKLDGGAIEDALVAGELGMLGYLVKCLRASGISDKAHAALRALPQAEYMDVLEAWGDHGDGDGASLGE